MCRHKHESLSYDSSLNPPVDGGDCQKCLEAGGNTLPTPHQAAIFLLEPGKRPLGLESGHHFFHIPPDLVVRWLRRMPVASGGQDLQVEHPVRRWHAAAFHFHPTQRCILRSPLGWDQGVHMCQAREQCGWAPTGMVASLHGEHLPVHGVMRLIQGCAHRWHLRVFKHRIPA